MSDWERDWRSIQHAFYQAADLWRKAEKEQADAKAKALRHRAKGIAIVATRKATLNSYKTLAEWLESVFGEAIIRSDRLEHLRAWRTDFDQSCVAVMDYIDGMIDMQRARDADCIPGWEGRSYRQYIYTPAEILEYAQDQQAYSASLHLEGERDAAYAIWRQAYRDCVRAIKKRLPRLSDLPFDIRDANACADEETDGLLPRIIEWFKKVDSNADRSNSSQLEPRLATLEDFALTLSVEKKTVMNWASEHKKPLPNPKVEGRGNRPHEYDLDELIEWSKEIPQARKRKKLA